MSDVSGAKGYVVDVLNFLAGHPTQSFTLSELAKKLGLSYGSAHRVLTMLTEAHYLSRHPKHKTYSLGVVLVAIGEAALEKHRSLSFARRELTRLTDALKIQCVAAAVVDDELLILAKEGQPQSREALSRVGERCPFVPPLGLNHVAWGNAQFVQSYFAKVPPNLDERKYAYLRNSLELVRKRGYTIAANGPALRALSQTSTVLIGQQHDDSYWSNIHNLISSLSDAEIQLLSFEQASRLRRLLYFGASLFANG